MSSAASQHTNGNNNGKRADATLVLSCTIRRKYGDVEIEYGLSGRYFVSTISGLNNAYDDLRAQVEAQHEAAIINRPSLMPQQLVDHTSQNEAIVLCTAVRKENVAGKERIRLLGGEYSTHGIAVYPEYFDALQIDPKTLDYGDTPYSGHVVILLDGRGNPKRAIKRVQEG